MWRRIGLKVKWTRCIHRFSTLEISNLTKCMEILIPPQNSEFSLMISHIKQPPSSIVYRQFLQKPNVATSIASPKLLGGSITVALLTSASLKVCTAKATPGERGRWWVIKTEPGQDVCSLISMCLRWVWKNMFVRCFFCITFGFESVATNSWDQKKIVQSFWGVFKKFNRSWRADLFAGLFGEF